MDDYKGWPLHFLVKSDHFYDDFLERLEDANKRDYQDNTLLHAGTLSGVDNSRILHLLIERGADVDATNPDGHTPLHFAVCWRNRGAFAALIEAGASINSKDFHGRTALHLAITKKWLYCSSSIFCKDCDIWIVKSLLSQPGIDLNPVDEGGETPLMWAVKEQNSAAFSWLLKKGADLNIPNKDHQIPLHAALSARNPNDYIVSLLLFHGSDLYCEDISRQTAMDILVHSIREHYDDTLKFAKGVLWLIAFKYRIRDCLWRKLEQIPDLYNYFDECFKEVRLMRMQIVCDKITLYDFTLDCFQTGFGDHVQEIYIPVFEILKSGLFKLYYDAILKLLLGPD